MMGSFGFLLLLQDFIIIKLSDVLLGIWTVLGSQSSPVQNTQNEEEREKSRDNTECYREFFKWAKRGFAGVRI